MEDLNNISEIEVSYRPSPHVWKTSSLQNSQGVFEFVRELFCQDQLYLQEQFIILYLNRSNRFLGYYRHSVGGLTGTVADIRIVLGVALKSAATSIILAHNHPSGNLRPSQADRDLTGKIKESCRIMDLQLLDHLIISSEEYFSFTDNGLI